jgi:hypothetical protein
MHSAAPFVGTERLCCPLMYRMLYCLLIIIVLALAAPVSAEDHTLNPGDSIQQNISTASDGDTIILNPGTYYQHGITISKNITIRANTATGGNAANTVIDGEITAYIFLVSPGITFALDNLTLKDGKEVNGGAIVADRETTLLITSSTFTNCSATAYGGAIAAHSSDIQITSSTFTNCSATMDGGSIYVWDGGALTILSSIFSNCSASHEGGAIYAELPLRVTSSTFTNCSAMYGGAIITSTDTTISSSTFSNCSASTGGAISAVGGGTTVTITSSTFSNCSASDGGAIFSGSDILNVSSSAFSNCSANGIGGAIYTSSNLTVSSSSFANCSATDNGGAIIAGSSTTIVSSTFSDCSTSSRGGAILVSGDTAISTSTFSNCSASDEGGAILTASSITLSFSTFSNCTATNRGGAISSYNGPLTVTSSSFIDGSASNGGALFTDMGTLTVTNSSFTDCSAASSGGALYSNGSTLTVNSSVFTRCSVLTDSGGALSSHGGVLNVSSSRFSDCSAPANVGGAIQISGSRSAIIASSFENCTAYNAGAIATSYDGHTPNEVGIISCSITNCSAVYGGAVSNYQAITTIRSCRMYNNGPSPVYNDGGYWLNATGNWWGTNAGPAGYIFVSVTTSPWLVMNISATPSTISTTQNSKIRVNLTRLSNGTDTTGWGIFVPAGIPVAFARTSGTGSISPQHGNVTSGSNTTTFSPAGAGTSTISAMVDGQTVAIPVVVRSPPTITAIKPLSGKQGALVQVTNLSGTGFKAGANVFFNKSARSLIATNVTVVSAKKITCTVKIPAGVTIGPWSVTVRNSDGNYGTKANAFTVKTVSPPTVTGITPATGKRGVLLSITNISGTGFVASPKPTIRFVKSAKVVTATNVTVSSTKKITCTVKFPAGAATGAWNVSVTNADGQAGTKASAFSVTI